jgi:putative oxidoreductase
MEQFDIAILIVRVWVGMVMLFHGINHGRSLEGTANWFEKVGFSSPKLNARISAMSEIAIGLAIAFGLLMSLAVAGMIAVMFVAFWTIHRFAGFFNFHRPDEGYEYVGTLALVGLAIATMGPGRYSVDHAIGLAEQLDGLPGAVVAAAGLVAGYGQTLIFWKRPRQVEQQNA